MNAHKPLVLGLVTLLIGVPLSAPAPARADGDPASDVLLGENVYYPYSPPVSAAHQRTLNATTAAAARQGFPIKVALIGAPVDLGVIPDLFGKPQAYARFLDQEITFRTAPPLLVVMAAGYGVAAVSPAATRAAATLPRPRSSSPDDLATAASAAVARLAAAAGHSIIGVPGIPGTGSDAGGAPALVIAAVAVLAVGLAGAVVVIARGRRARRAA